MKARRKMCGSSSSSSSSSLKREFLKEWMKGLQICRSHTKSVSERRDAIKSSADVAIAATRGGATGWRRAALRDVVSRDRSNGALLVGKIVGEGVVEDSRRIACSRRILRRSRRRGRRRVAVVPKSCTNRRRALQRVVPGGEGMDGASLLRETLDYIVALRAQVDVMRRVAEAAARR